MFIINVLNIISINLHLKKLIGASFAFSTLILITRANALKFNAISI